MTFLGRPSTLQNNQYTEKCGAGSRCTWRSWRSPPDEKDRRSCRGLDDSKNQDLHGRGWLSGAVKYEQKVPTDRFGPLGPLVNGAITCAKAPPIGFMMAMTIVAVVLPRASNHSSLYFAGSTWKTACEMLAKNFQITRVSHYRVGQEGCITHLTDEEEGVGSIARERARSASIPNPGGDNQADGAEIALEQKDRYKSLGGNWVGVVCDIPPSSGCTATPTKVSRQPQGCTRTP